MCIFQPLPGMAGRTLSCSSLSKTFSITGWRIGYVHASRSIIAQARKVHDFLTIGAAAPLQHAVVTALKFPESYYSRLAAGYLEQREILCGYLDRTGLPYSKPEGAYFVMVDISRYKHASDLEFSRWMAREIGVAPVPGSSFFPYPENRYIRLHFAKGPNVLHAAGERLLLAGLNSAKLGSGWISFPMETAAQTPVPAKPLNPWYDLAAFSIGILAGMEPGWPAHNRPCSGAFGCRARWSGMPRSSGPS